jgi:hypothetical protein
LVVAALKKVVAAVDASPVILQEATFEHDSLQDIIDTLKEMPAGIVWIAWTTVGWVAINQNPDSVDMNSPIELTGEDSWNPENDSLGVTLDKIAKELNGGEDLKWASYTSADDFSKSDRFVESVLATCNNAEEVECAAQNLEEEGYGTSASILGKMTVPDSVYDGQQD